MRQLATAIKTTGKQRVWEAGCMPGLQLWDAWSYCMNMSLISRLFSNDGAANSAYCAAALQLP